ncbi:MAG: MFS transporter, partial [Actinomycetota bacterium]|nr:MFS transporter [Actinomycetota bacterium]
ATVSEDVRRAFDVGDDQLGLLFGAYAFVAAASVLPFGYIADRWNRVWLIALGFIPWSIAMFWTGASQTFAMMFLARLFLGSIEATNGPSTPSLLGDFYPVGERGRVLGVYGAGALVGALLGFVAAGILATLFDWRTAFYVWGALGLVCGVLVWRLLPEPARGISDALHHAEEQLAEFDAPRAVETPAATREVVGTLDYRTLGFADGIREIVKVKTLWIAVVAGIAGEFFFSALATWAPTFFRRYHGFSAAGAGALVATLALSVVAGIAFGARMSDRQLRRGHPTQRIVMAGVSQLAAVATIMIAFGFDSLALVIPFFLASGFLIGVPMAPSGAVQLDIIVPRLRGRAAAVRSILRATAIGTAPIVFGFMSDEYGLRSAMLLIAPMLGVAGAITLLAVRTYPRDMAHCQAESLRQQQLEPLVAA